MHPTRIAGVALRIAAIAHVFFAKCRDVLDCGRRDETISKELLTDLVGSQRLANEAVADRNEHWPTEEHSQECCKVAAHRRKQE